MAVRRLGAPWVLLATVVVTTTSGILVPTPARAAPDRAAAPSAPTPPSASAPAAPPAP